MKKCPICNLEDFFLEGECVDIGVGFQKVGPDSCDNCGFVEPSPYNSNDMPFEYYQFCYQNKISSNLNRRLFKLRNGDLPKEYKNYIDGITYENAYGKCREKCIEMMEIFPHLKCVYGFFYDSCWGQRGHFWLYDPDFDNLIVDPTHIQFPGNGLYEPLYSIDPQTKKRLDWQDIEKTLFEMTGKEFKFKIYHENEI